MCHLPGGTAIGPAARDPGRPGWMPAARPIGRPAVSACSPPSTPRPPDHPHQTDPQPVPATPQQSHRRASPEQADRGGQSTQPVNHRQDQLLGLAGSIDRHQSGRWIVAKSAGQLSHLGRRRTRSSDGRREFVQGSSRCFLVSVASLQHGPSLRCEVVSLPGHHGPAAPEDQAVHQPCCGRVQRPADRPLGRQVRPLDEAGTGRLQKVVLAVWIGRSPTDPSLVRINWHLGGSHNGNCPSPCQVSRARRLKSCQFDTSQQPSEVAS